MHFWQPLYIWQAMVAYGNVIRIKFRFKLRSSMLLFIITYLLELWILLFALVLLFNPNPTFLIYHWWIKLLKNKYFVQKQPSRGAVKKRCFENMQQIYRITPMPKCDFNKVGLQLYWNHTLAWVFCCKFAAYFQKISS